MLRSVNNNFNQLKESINNLLNVLSNIEKQKIKLFNDYNLLKGLIKTKIPETTDEDIYKNLLKYFNESNVEGSINYEKINELFKSGIKFNIDENEPDVCMVVNEAVNKQFEVLLGIYQQLLDMDRVSFNLKKFRMLYNEDIENIINSIQPQSLEISDDYIIKIYYDKNGDLKEQLAKVLFRFINVNNLLIKLIPNNKLLRENIGYLIKSNKAVGDYNVYSIDELYDTIIKMSEETVNFMNNNCNKPVGDLKKTIEIRITIINTLLIFFNETMQVLLEIIKELNKNPAEFLVKDEIEKQKDGNIITYIKLRSDNNNYNERFQVFVNKNRRELVIGHNPYLGGDTDLTKTIIKNTQSNQFMYDGYGIFDNVFLPNEKNVDISKKLNRLKDSIDSGKSVCLIAYGASGAGKTSTLLYFRGVPGKIEPENGIIPNLCNILKPEYTKITISAKELRANYNDTDKKYWETLDVLDKPAIFNREGNEWLSKQKSFNVINYNKLHETAICENDKPYEGIPREQKEFTDREKILLGDFIGSLIDIRLNCGTTNNPDSSRTHMLVFVKFNDGPTLIVADLAGVEKPFDCDSLVVLENFARNKKYYKNINEELSKIMGGSLDPIFDRLEKKIDKGEDIDISDITIKRLSEVSFGSYSTGKSTFNITMYTFFNNPEAIFNNLKGDNYIKYMKSLQLFCNFVNRGGYFQILKERIVDKKVEKLTISDVEKTKRFFDKTSERKFYTEIIKPITATDGAEQYRKRVSNIYTGNSGNYAEIILYKDPKTKLIKLVIDEIIKLENYFTILRDQTTGVCRTRTKEGYFITKSLGELRNLIRVFAASSSVGPSFIVACYPLLCPEYMNSTECLPKYGSKLPENFISSILQTMKEGGIKDIDNLVFCVFNVCNLTSNKVTDPIRQIYSPLGDLLAPSLEAINKVEKLRRKIIEKMMNVEINDYHLITNKIMTNLNNLVKSKEEFIALFSLYKKEMEQIDLTKIPSEEKQIKYFEDSKEIWANISSLSNEIKNDILDKENSFYKLSLLNDFTLLDKIKLEIKKIIKDDEDDNSTTLIGTMSFIEEVAKLGRRTLKCYVQEKGLEYFKLNSDNYISLN